VEKIDLSVNSRRKASMYQALEKVIKKHEEGGEDGSKSESLYVEDLKHNWPER